MRERVESQFSHLGELAFYDPDVVLDRPTKSPPPRRDGFCLGHRSVHSDRLKLFNCDFDFRRAASYRARFSSKRSLWLLRYLSRSNPSDVRATPAGSRELRKRVASDDIGSFLNLVVAATTLWDTVCPEWATAASRLQREIDKSLMPHIAPSGWNRVKLAGDYV